MVKRRQPWWIPPFLGRVPAEIDEPSLRLLGAVAFALLFEEYDQAMVTSALKQISADLAIAERQLGLYLALIRLGALPAFLLIPLADRIGRRPVFVFATATMGLLTFATAFAQTSMQFVGDPGAHAHLLRRRLRGGIRDRDRGVPGGAPRLGMGMLAALGAVGHGLSAAAFSQIDRLPYGWRALYAFGIVPVLLCRGSCGASRRPALHAPGCGERCGCRRARRRHARPLRAVCAAARAGRHPPRARRRRGAHRLRRSGCVTAQLPVQRLLHPDQARLVAGAVSMMVIAGGGVGIIGNIVGGRLGDSWGRKRVGVMLLSVFPLAAVGFYQGPTPVVIALWVALVFCSMGGRVILRAMATELFPTSQRGAASGLYAVLEVLGAVVGLLAIHAYRPADISELALAVSLISCVIWIAALVLLRFPETRLRESKRSADGGYRRVTAPSLLILQHDVALPAAGRHADRVVVDALERERDRLVLRRVSTSDPACGTGSTQRISMWSMSRSQCPRLPSQLRVPSTSMPSARPPASGRCVRSPLPLPVRPSESRVQVSSCTMCRLGSLRFQVTVGVAGDRDAAVAEAPPSVCLTTHFVVVVALDRGSSCVPANVWPRKVQLPGSAPYSMVRVASCERDLGARQLRVHELAHVLGGLGSTASPIVKSVLTSTLAEVSAAACESTDDSSSASWASSRVSASMRQPSSRRARACSSKRFRHPRSPHAAVLRVARSFESNRLRRRRLRGRARIAQAIEKRRLLYAVCVRRDTGGAAPRYAAPRARRVPCCSLCPGRSRRHARQCDRRACRSKPNPCSTSRSATSRR